MQKYENSVPGPGAYTQVRKSLSPAWTFGSRNKELFGKHEESPGPGAYTLPVPKVVTAKISKSHSVTPIKETPGPGSYIMDPHNFFSNPISYHPGNSNRTDFTRSFQDLPGPGSYNLNSSLNKIGGKISPEGRSKQQNLTENFPGPGTYDPKLPENSSSFSLAGKKNPEKIPDFPGPGSYSVKSEKVPSFSIGKKIDQKNTTNGPGPGSYKIPNKPISPAWTFKSRLFPKPKEEGPGPGQYYLTSMLNSKGFSFSKFEEKPLKNNLPGPGQYATEKPRFESPGFSLGKGPRTDFAKLRSETPGPRAYDSFLNTSLSKISTKFSKAKRPNFSNAEDSAGFYKIDLKPEGPFYSIQGKANLKNTEKTPVTFT